jgi:hypothetical protein
VRSTGEVAGIEGRRSFPHPLGPTGLGDKLARGYRSLAAANDRASRNRSPRHTLAAAAGLPPHRHSHLHGFMHRSVVPLRSLFTQTHRVRHSLRCGVSPPEPLREAKRENRPGHTSCEAMRCSPTQEAGRSQERPTDRHAMHTRAQKKSAMRVVLMSSDTALTNSSTSRVGSECSLRRVSLKAPGAEVSLSL